VIFREGRCCEKLESSLGRLCTGEVIGRILSGGVGSSSSLKVKSTTCGGPRFLE